MTKTKQEKQIVDIMQNIKLLLGLQITFRDPDIIKYNTGMVEFEWASKYQVTKDFEHHYKSTKKNIKKILLDTTFFLRRPYTQFTVYRKTKLTYYYQHYN